MGSTHATLGGSGAGSRGGTVGATLGTTGGMCGRGRGAVGRGGGPVSPHVVPVPGGNKVLPFLMPLFTKLSTTNDVTKNTTNVTGTIGDTSTTEGTLTRSMHRGGRVRTVTLKNGRNHKVCLEPCGANLKLCVAGPLGGCRGKRWIVLVSRVYPCGCYGLA